MRMSRARLLAPPHADPPTTNRSKGIRPYRQVLRRSRCELRGRRYESPTPASPPVSRRDGLIAGSALPGPWGGRRPLPDELSATRRDGLASELSQLGTRGGPHRTTQPHTICRRPVGGLGWVQLPRAAHLTCSYARHAGLPFYLQHPGNHARRKFNLTKQSATEPKAFFLVERELAIESFSNSLSTCCVVMCTWNNFCSAHHRQCESRRRIRSD
jgi:hypothetical protein